MAARAITLGEVGAGGWLDLDDPANKKIFINGSKPLHGDPYDGKPKGLRLFLERLRGRSTMYSWNNVLDVPDMTFLATTRNIIDCYGSVTLEECTQHADAYYLARDRASQNAQMLYNCLSTSLTDEALSKVTMMYKKYTVRSYQDGLCFLKILLSNAKPDTVATVNMLRTSISELKSKMIEFGGNIVEFNEYVRNIETSLTSYGETADGLLINVILAYEEVEDTAFVSYIQHKRSMWEEDKTVLELDTLMSNSENKYKIAIQTGKWKAPTKQAEEFAAMKAEWHKNHNSNATTNTNSSGSGDTKTKDKISYADRMKRDVEANPWKIIPPGVGESQVTVKKGSTFKWCATHKKWMGHSTAECLGLGINMRNQNKNNGKNVAYQATGNDSTSGVNSALTAPTNATPSVQVNNAMMSLTKGAYGMFE
jgi:hypothetical protein